MIQRTIVGACAMLLLTSASLISWSTYTDEARGFEIKYPASWEQKELYNAAFFVSPKEATVDQFQENLSISVQDLSLSAETITLESYTALSEQQIKSLYGESAVEYIKNTSLVGYEAAEMVYFMPSTTATGTTMRLTIWQVWFIKDKNAYLITFTSEDKEFDNNIATIKEAVGSFKLL